ncbi:MAG: ribonuclease P protein component [Anditalea sp.]
MNYKLQKNERLHSKKSIRELFDKGSSFFLYPFKVLHMTLDAEHAETNQVLFSVSKRKVKKAVHRNYVKRRIKEAYRLNKHLLSSGDVKNRIALIYVSTEQEDFHTIQEKVQKILKRIAGPN